MSEDEEKTDGSKNTTATEAANKANQTKLNNVKHAGSTTHSYVGTRTWRSHHVCM